MFVTAASLGPSPSPSPPLQRACLRIRSRPPTSCNPFPLPSTVMTRSRCFRGFRGQTCPSASYALLPAYLQPRPTPDDISVSTSLSCSLPSLSPSFVLPSLSLADTYSARKPSPVWIRCLLWGSPAPGIPRNRPDPFTSSLSEEQVSLCPWISVPRGQGQGCLQRCSRQGQTQRRVSINACWLNNE